MDKYDLNRFIEAQKVDFDVAIKELSQGRKYSHWMWYVFPQIKGLGCSYMSDKYSIRNIDEAKEYLGHKILGSRLIKCCNIILNLENQAVSEIFTHPDNLKFHSSLTLFSNIDTKNSVFQKLLNKHFNGELDSATKSMLNI